MEGFISINRQILSWEWYTDNNVKSLFIHCLLKANFKDKNWRGQLIKRGSLITSISHLSIELGLSIQQIRSGLDKLKSTNEITIKSTNKNTLITIVKYDEYQNYKQSNNKQNNNQTTFKEQTDNNQITTTNNDNKGNNDNNENKKIPFSHFWDLYDKKVGDKSRIKKKWDKLSLKNQNEAIDHIKKYKEAQPDKQFRKNPETYLNQKSWNDEIIERNSTGNTGPTKGKDRIADDFSETL